MDVSSRSDDMVRYAGEKGSCDLFPTLVRIRSTGAGPFRGKLVFVGTASRYESRTYKNTTCALQNKKEGLYPKGQKSGSGCFFRHLDSEMVNIISEHSDIYVSIYLNSYISEHLCARISEHLHIGISMYPSI
ncbi:hypothetical protein [Sphingobacterium sp. SYP-B4668]|uniref:hypothetical protein n=1 Tax=Sphingobacterium sp. SYP-B4668 TaxID=2996035 RepID=UPI0022DE3FBC|nr:hypothetical protein [Sphingobacterium sp. SYP-B4668]